ncbi:TetR/AcrR family transcriptional regulator [Shimia thalassica]|uniref:TetR/AcrR family transcriptional regulator n=1 Tax=Shimia thalassica TaxID=1715693 RepID=UPI0026E25923|nr:TetR/AcrR family transcriptional regulator [Shimia thalassica]MDO6798160.1 TetR/AcrR family transcriptional regulator [Shimia thalassica]MDP2579491.1 TetR/AcrR family transcriptional regulator [Shimia thalassica]
MKTDFTEEKQRQRAPSKRSLETKARILDAAERLFAERGFEGASVRDIAKEAGVQVGLVTHHAGPKEDLFARIVTRRADELAAGRLSALASRHEHGKLALPDILESFFEPYLYKAETGGPQWLAYARLVAIVSADPHWRPLAERCFDPTANRFIDAICALYPDTPRQVIAAGFVYSVSAMLALVTSRWRVNALGDPRPDAASHLDELVAFCAAGIEACATSTPATSSKGS